MKGIALLIIALTGAFTYVQARVKSSLADISSGKAGISQMTGTLVAKVASTNIDQTSQIEAYTQARKTSKDTGYVITEDYRYQDAVPLESPRAKSIDSGPACPERPRHGCRDYGSFRPKNSTRID
ncbi:MAG: hypothetical protein HRU19_06575 [Pseudobacteriovorax sp.]|nr:hypothetical protein [Pseudobacteriovorax sp.]